MISLSSHVLDTGIGKPAEGLDVTLFEEYPSGWKVVCQGTTNSDGRLGDFVEAGRLKPRFYKLIFDVGGYYAASKTETLYRKVEIEFRVADGHYHIPLLLSPFGYSTYRGS